jgi:hypothetical protein
MKQYFLVGTIWAVPLAVELKEGRQSGEVPKSGLYNKNSSHKK